MAGSSRSDQFGPLLSNDSSSTRPQTLFASKSTSRSDPLFSTSTFSCELLSNSPDTFILGDFNAHHPTWDITSPPTMLAISRFNWISSTHLDILNNPDIYTLLHHSSGSCSSPVVSLAPSYLASTCEWRTLPGLGSDHLPIDINLQLAPICHTNTRAPAFNFKKAHSDEFKKFITEHQGRQSCRGSGTAPLVLTMRRQNKSCPLGFSNTIHFNTCAIVHCQKLLKFVKM